MSEELSYYQSHKDELKAYNKRYREEHKDELKAYNKRYYGEHKDELKASVKRYREEHKDELKASGKRYREEHKDELKAYNKRYSEEHKDELKIKHKQYYIINRDKIIQSVKRCQKNNPSISLKQSSYKRGLGYLPLNDYFKGSHAHHLLLEDNIWFCVHIPAFLHSFFRHRSDTFKGMLTINAVALSYWLIDYQFFKDD